MKKRRCRNVVSWRLNRPNISMMWFLIDSYLAEVTNDSLEMQSANIN